MKKLFIFTSTLGLLLCNTVLAKTIVCPTATQANKLFKNCQIEVGKNSCGATFKGTPIVLNSPTEGIYGGQHRFEGFTQFQSIEILSHYFVCKYDLTESSQKMAWIIGSRHALSKNCHLTDAKPILGIPTCQNKNPDHCKIVCA